MNTSLIELGGLFLISFGAATILPIQSEWPLAALIYGKDYSSLTLLIVATIGNVLGALFNWWLGRYIVHFQHRRWFPFREKHIAHATQYYQRWGVWTLLLAWAPIIGDPLTLVAGIFRTDIRTFLILVTIGKMARYAALIALFPA